MHESHYASNSESDLISTETTTFIESEKQVNSMKTQESPESSH